MTIFTGHYFIDLICLLCICVRLTVKMQFDNTGTYEYSSYSPCPLLGHYARSRVWAPLFRNSASPSASTNILTYMQLF